MSRIARGLLLGAALSVSAVPPGVPQQVGGAAAWPVLGLGAEAGRVSNPAFIAHAGDRSGRLFVGERGGRVLAFGGEAPGPAAFLDIRERVSAAHGGLRGLAFPYDFVDKRYFCVSYGAATGDLVIARYRLGADGAGDAASEQVLLRIMLPAAERPGGGIAFGLDGKLYVGVGEGEPAAASRGAAQDRGSLAGKILRIEADPGAGARPVPADNPWAKSAGARPEIWAVGVGNPSWLGFDPKTGDLHLTDSLGDRQEELNVQPGRSAGGENYGWNLIEGTRCRPKQACPSEGFTPPAVALPRKSACELIGGAIARDSGTPGLDGIALFGDRCSGRILGLRRDDAGAWEERKLLDTDLRIAALGVGEGGEIYVADEGSGAIRRIVAGAPGKKP